MKQIIAEYISTLKERDELDALLPQLLLSMDMNTLSEVQIGVRQRGVDISAVGIIPEDNQKKLFLFVIKQGNIGRRDWNVTPQSIMQSLDEIKNVYVRSNISQEYRDLPIVIVVCTSGKMLQALEADWAGYTNNNSQYAEFKLWDLDKLSIYVEKYMLNEHLLLDGINRLHFKTTLSLLNNSLSESLNYFSILLNRLLNISEGQVMENQPRLADNIKLINLLVNIINKHSKDNLKNNYFIAERALLWTKYVVYNINARQKSKIDKAYGGLFETYLKIADEYVQKILPYANFNYGFSIHSQISALNSISIYEQIGILSTIALVYNEQSHLQERDELINILICIINKNSAFYSPMLDRNSTEISLLLYLLSISNNSTSAQVIIKNLIDRYYYAMKKNYYFPISNDSIEDLAEIVYGNCDEEKRISLQNSASWILPILAGWAAILNDADSYIALLDIKQTKPEMVSQLWYPTSDYRDKCYYQSIQHDCGYTYVFTNFPETIDQYKDIISIIINDDKYNIKIDATDLIAFRHYNTPLPPIIWQKLLFP